MLRKAMYASLHESKRPLTKFPNELSTTSSETLSRNGPHVFTVVDSKEEELISKQHVSPDELDNNNGGGESGKNIDANHPSLQAYPEMKKKMKISKEPSKLLNYVIKKKKEKRTNSRALIRTLSPTKLSGNAETGFPGSLNGKSKKKKRRQRGALAVFVAMNKSAGGKILSKNHFSKPEKEQLLKSKRKRRRKRKEFENEICSQGDGAGVGNEESPPKKSKKEDKK